MATPHRCLTALAAVSSVMASSVACDSGGAATPPSSPAVLDDPASIVPAAEASQLVPAPAVTATDVRGTESTAWRLVSIGVDGRRLEVRAVAGDGFLLDGRRLARPADSRRGGAHVADP